MGYFRSSALLAWTGALPRLAFCRTATIRLLASPELAADDAHALEQALDPVERQRLEAQFCASFIVKIVEDPGYLGDHAVRTRLLAWLIAQGHLEIRFAFPQHLTEPGIYHEKIGVFTFSSGDIVAFTGSANESRAGYHTNWESIDVYRSWVPADLPRVLTKSAQFAEAWEGRAPGLEVCSLSLETLERIKALAPEEKPTLPPWLVGDYEELALYSFQAEALGRWEANNRLGLLEMCTGSGKTLTAIEAMRRTFAATPIDIAIVTCPTKVLADQWISELCKKNPTTQPIAAFDSASDYSSHLQLLLTSPSRHDPGRVIVTTYVTFSSRPFQSQLRAAAHIGRRGLLIADEAHHLSSKTGLEQILEMGDFFIHRLALTATPELEGNPEATDQLLGVFGGRVFEFSLQQAIAEGILCPYYYYPRPVFLSDELSAEYASLLVQCERSSEVALVELYRLRRELLRKSGMHLAELARLLDEFQDQARPLDLTVVFTPPGREDDDQRILAKVKAELERRHIFAGSIVAASPQQERRAVLAEFRRRNFKVLLGIGCLDEGLDVPEARTAIVLYSVDRMKQFIQRRGRVLRKAPGKSSAAVFDLLFLPHGSDLPEEQAAKMLDRELRRYREFAAGALNKAEAAMILDQALSVATGRSEAGDV